MSYNCCTNCIPLLLTYHAKNRDMDLTLQQQKAEINRLKFEKQLKEISSSGGEWPRTLDSYMPSYTPRSVGGVDPWLLSEEIEKKYKSQGLVLKHGTGRSDTVKVERKVRRHSHTSSRESTEEFPTKDTSQPKQTINSIKNSIQSLAETAKNLHSTAKAIQSPLHPTALLESPPLPTSKPTPLTHASVKPEATHSNSNSDETLGSSFISSESSVLDPPVISGSEYQMPLQLQLTAKASNRGKLSGSPLMSPLKESDLKFSGEGSSKRFSSMKRHMALNPLQELLRLSATGKGSSLFDKSNLTLDELGKGNPSPHRSHRGTRFAAVPQSFRGSHYIPITESLGRFISKEGTELNLDEPATSAVRKISGELLGGFTVYKDADEALAASGYGNAAMRVSCYDPAFDLSHGALLCSQVVPKEVLFGSRVSSVDSSDREHLD